MNKKEFQGLKDLFHDEIGPMIKNFIKVEVNEDYLQKISAFVEKVTEAKESDIVYATDNKKKALRFNTGVTAEAAIEQYLGISFIDWSVSSSSRKYNHADIQGFNVGVKSAEYGKSILIPKVNKYPQIVCIKDIENENVVYICGVATVDILNTYQDDNLVLSPFLKERGCKTGFAFEGYKHLIPLDEFVEQLKEAQAS